LSPGIQFFLCFCVCVRRLSLFLSLRLPGKAGLETILENTKWKLDMTTDKNPVKYAVKL
jgi:hypothetical protein